MVRQDGLREAGVELGASPLYYIYSVPSTNKSGSITLFIFYLCDAYLIFFWKTDSYLILVDY